MRKMNIIALIIAVFVFFSVFDVISCVAQEFEEHEQDALNGNTAKYHSMIATAYCLNGTTATGTQTRAGVAAGKREWFGKKVKVYWNDGGEPGGLIGEYVIEDTGSSPIRKGKVIDLWMPTKDECFEFGRQRVLVQVMED